MDSSSSDHLHSSLPELLPTPDGHRQCSGCERVIYNDPKLAVAAIVPLDGGIVLVRRAIEPAYGKWSFPSGYVNRGEQVERALEREVLEETGLVVEVGPLIAVYTNPNMLLTYPDGNKWQIVVMHFACKPIGGELATSSETLRVNYFPKDDIPTLNIGDFDRLRIQHGFQYDGSTLIHETIKIN